MSGTAGSFTASTGTVNFNAAGAQSIAPFAYTFNNVTLSGSNAKTTTNASINGILSMEGTATTTGTVPTYGADATLQYKGSAAQTTGTEFPATFGGTGGVIINNANGVILAASKTTTYGLTLTSGNITTNAYILTIGSAGSVSRTDGHIIGNLQKYVAIGATSRTFEVGTADAYNPVTVAFGSVATAGNLTAKVTAGQHPNIGTSTINSSKDVNEYWSLTNSGVVFDNYSVTFNFSPGDILGEANTSLFIVGNYNGSGWTDPYPTVGTKEATSTQAIGLTYFGEFAIGEVAIIIIPITIDISVPSSISFGNFNIGNNSINGTLTVNVSPSNTKWYITASDLNSSTAGRMTLWDGLSYNTSVKLTAMNVSGNDGDVNNLSIGGNISRETGNYSGNVTFKQEVTWYDDPGTYQIVVTFTAWTE